MQEGVEETREEGGRGKEKRGVLGGRPLFFFPFVLMYLFVLFLF